MKKKVKQENVSGKLGFKLYINQAMYEGGVRYHALLFTKRDGCSIIGNQAGRIIRD